MLQKIIDGNDKIQFHPALDIQNNILVLGFRVKDENGREGNVYIIGSNDKLFASKEPIFELEETKFSIKDKSRLLPKLSQKWNSEGLNFCLEQFDNPTVKIPSSMETFEKIKNLLTRHIEMDDNADYTLLTAWIIGTYFFPAFAAYPYVHIKAPKGSGKSQCLKFIEQTAFNAVKARASLPALRDTVDALRGTFIMDQADILNKKTGMEEFLDILTDSYKRGGGQSRKMVKDSKSDWVVSEFEAYGPKAFGSIKQLPEDLRDRCIELPLLKSNKNYPDLDEESSVWREIRGELYMLLIKNFSFVAATYIATKSGYRENAELHGRKLELWLPVETILVTLNIKVEAIEATKKKFINRYEFAKFELNELEGAVMSAIKELMGENDEAILMPQQIANVINPDLFDDHIKNWPATLKQKSSLVGRIIKNYNLANQKLSRVHKGERYYFTRDRIQKTFDGYFTIDEEAVPVF